MVKDRIGSEFQQVIAFVNLFEGHRVMPFQAFTNQLVEGFRCSRRLNLTIRGIDAQIAHGDTFHNDGTPT